MINPQQYLVDFHARMLILYRLINLQKRPGPATAATLVGGQQASQAQLRQRQVPHQVLG